MRERIEWALIVVGIFGGLGVIGGTSYVSWTADDRLTEVIAAQSGIERAQDETLTAIAERRVSEIQADWSHRGQQPGTFEVLAFNMHEHPASRAATQWKGSAPHQAILSDPDLTRIGCAVAVANRYYFACVLSP